MSSRLQALAFAGAMVVSATGWAQDESPVTPPEPVVDAAPATGFTLDVGPLPIEFHGYASQAWVKSDRNQYYTTESADGTFHITEAALNGAVQVTDRTRIVLQLAAVMNDLEARPTLQLDFGFVDHRFADAFGVRIGRFRNLTNLYSEVWDTDIARLPIFLPTAVYDPQGRQIFMNSQGLQVYGSVRSSSAGSLDYAASVGALAPFMLQGTSDDVDFMANARIVYNTPLEGLKIGGSAIFGESAIASELNPLQTIGLVQAGLVPPTFDGIIRSNMEGLWRFSAFAELNLGGWTLAAEYSHMSYEVTIDDPTLAVLAQPFSATPDGIYVLTAYRFNDSFAAGAYASAYFVDAGRRDSKNPADHSFDYAATFRYDVNSYLAFKTELHRIYGTALLDPTLNPEGPEGNTGWLFALRASAAF